MMCKFANRLQHPETSTQHQEPRTKNPAMSHDHVHEEPAKPAVKKKFHKRLLHAHRHVTKYLYERDTIFATLWVFLFIVILGSVPINFYFLNPLKLALKDFDFNDMAYSKLEKTKGNKLDNRIVIINIGDLDREGLAMLVEKTASMQPKVIGLDVLFDGAREPEQDSLMVSIMEKYPNLVTAYKLDWDKHSHLFFKTRNHFEAHSSNSAFVNFDNDDKETTRYFYPFKKDEKSVYESFSTRLVKTYDPKAYETLINRKKQLEIITYTRRVTADEAQYQIIEPENLLGGMVEDTAIRGKIALLGYINLNPSNIEDKKFTPLNEKFAGKSIPDMNGIVVHANIISMILDHNYIKKLPSWFNWLAAILIGWLHMSFFVRYYLEDHIWFHLVAKIAQLLSAIFFVYVGIYLYSRYGIKLDMKMTLIVIVMAVDVIYFYEAFAVWMHKKFGYKTVFHQKHH
jgi:CHASE2 domain-containing sensor protein